MRRNSSVLDPPSSTPSNINTKLFDNISANINNIATSQQQISSLLDSNSNDAVRVVLNSVLNMLGACTTQLDLLRQSVAHNCAEEQERRRSIVMIGLPDQPDEAPSARVDKDEKLVTGVLNDLGIESRPVAIYRMGRWVKPNPAGTGYGRLIKVVFPAAKFQHHCLGSWRRNREQLRAQPGLNRLLIRPSLTREQREQERMQREQKRRRRDNTSTETLTGTGPFPPTHSVLTQ